MDGIVFLWTNEKKAFFLFDQSSVVSHGRRVIPSIPLVGLISGKIERVLLRSCRLLGTRSLEPGCFERFSDYEFQKVLLLLKTACLNLVSVIFFSLSHHPAAKG